MGVSNDLFWPEHILNSIQKIEELLKILHSFENFEKRWIERNSISKPFLARILAEFSSISFCVAQGSAISHGIVQIPAQPS